MKHTILLLLLVTSCGIPRDNTPSSPELVEYVQELLPLFNRSQILFPIYFASDEDMGNMAGACSIDSRSKYPIRIRIKQSSWEGYTENTKRTLILHELFHCLYGIGHSHSPSDLMHPKLSHSIVCTYQNGIEKCAEKAKVIFEVTDRDIQGAL